MFCNLVNSDFGIIMSNIVGYNSKITDTRQKLYQGENSAQLYLNVLSLSSTTKTKTELDFYVYFSGTVLKYSCKKKTFGPFFLILLYTFIIIFKIDQNYL